MAALVVLKPFRIFPRRPLKKPEESLSKEIIYIQVFKKKKQDGIFMDKPKQWFLGCDTCANYFFVTNLKLA